MKSDRKPVLLERGILYDSEEKLSVKFVKVKLIEVSLKQSESALILKTMFYVNLKRRFNL